MINNLKHFQPALKNGLILLTHEKKESTSLIAIIFKEPLH